MDWFHNTNTSYILGGINMNQQIKNALASYGRSVLGAATAMYASGVTDPKTLAYSLLGALIPVALRAANPNDLAFGKMPSVEEVDKAVKTAKVVKKAPAKKAAVRKVPRGAARPE
jgi:hypothetical protein